MSNKKTVLVLMDTPRLIEQLKTIKNLAEISLLITDKEHLLPSILELLYFEAQNMVESQCIKNIPS